MTEPTDSRPPPPPTPVREVAWSRPFHWLALGMADLLRCPLPGLAHGLLCSAFGLTLALLAHERFWILAGASSGFLILAPLVATGLFEISRQLSLGRQPGLTDVVRVWRSGDARMMRFGVLLAIAGTGWVLTSAALITGFAPMPIRAPADFLHHIVLNPQTWLFEVWLLLGGLLAAPMFASSVVAMPMMLDRPDTSMHDAVLTSWRAVAGSPFALALWAFVLAALCTIGIGTAMLGLIVIVPWLAHASWHAYRDIVADDRRPRGQGTVVR